MTIGPAGSYSSDFCLYLLFYGVYLFLNIKINFSEFKFSKKVLSFFIIIFLIFLAYACNLMKNKINDTLEQHIGSYIKNLSLMPSERFERELTRLINIANYIETHPDTLFELLQRMDASKEDFKKRGFSTGILASDYIPIQGEKLFTRDFQDLPLAFQGNDIIDYCPGKGLLVASPIQINGKIEYVIYNLFSEEVLQDRFGLNDEANENHILITDRKGKVIIPYSEYNDDDKIFLVDENISKDFSIIKERLLKDRVAVIYSSMEKGNFFLFGANVPKTNFIMLGFVSWEAVAGNIFFVNILVMALIIFIIIILVFLFKINEKARENEEKKQIAEEASHYKSAFLANMSHDIRTPLGGIIGFNELILRESNSPILQNYSQNIANLAEILLALVNDILDLSKIEAGHLELQNRNYFLIEMIRNLINMITPRTKEKDLDFKVMIDKDTPDELFGDMVQIQRVVANFLTNAVKYTPCGGIEFSVKSNRKLNDEIDLQFIVVDTGIGIRDEDKERLFSKFARLDLQKNRSIEGTGLGLALSRELVNLMNGKIEFESFYGEGSIFKITIPQKIVGEKLIGNFNEHLNTEHLEKSVQINFIAPDADILIVDDDKVNQEVYINMLTRIKARVETASSGAECLEKIKHKKYDLIFLDQMMPGLNGTETMNKLRENNSFKTPIVVLTADAMTGQKEKYLSDGFDDYLSKPIDKKELSRILKKFLK